MTTGPDRWYFGGRWYATTLASDVHLRDGIGLELDDVAPAPGRGQVLEAFRDDTTGELTLTALITDPLPFALVEQGDVPPGGVTDLQPWSGQRVVLIMP